MLPARAGCWRALSWPLYKNTVPGLALFVSRCWHLIQWPWCDLVLGTRLGIRLT